MRRYWFLAIAGAIVAALAVPLSASAAGSAVLTVGGSTTAVVSGDGLSGTNTVNATFVNGSNSNQKVTCTGSTLTATAGNNPAPPPGKATETNSSQTFSGCSISGVFGATGINSITTNASSACPWNVTVDDSTSPATVTISPATAGGSCGSSPSISATVNVQTIFGAQMCVYSPTSGNIVGSSAEGSTSLGFSNVGFTKTSGPGTCFGTANFSETYSITDTTQGGGAVQVN